MKDDVIAIIPARSGSKSILDKNITPLFDYPIISYSIIAAQLANSISRIIISTDSEKYAEISKKYGAEVPFIRPQSISADDSTDRDFFLHAMSWLKENEGHVPEYFVHLRPTTPMRDPKIIDSAIEVIRSQAESTSLRSGHISPESPLKWFEINEKGYFEGLIRNSDDPEYYNQPKEKFPPVYIPNGYVDIVKSSHVMESENLHGKRMIGFETEACSEIDSKQELNYIEFQLGKKGSVLLDELKSRF